MNNGIAQSIDPAGDAVPGMDVVGRPDPGLCPLLTRYWRAPKSDAVKSGDRHSHVVRLLIMYLC